MNLTFDYFPSISHCARGPLKILDRQYHIDFKWVCVTTKPFRISLLSFRTNRGHFFHKQESGRALLFVSTVFWSGSNWGMGMKFGKMKKNCRFGRQGLISMTENKKAGHIIPLFWSTLYKNHFVFKVKGSLIL